MGPILHMKRRLRLNGKSFIHVWTPFRREPRDGFDICGRWARLKAFVCLESLFSSFLLLILQLLQHFSTQLLYTLASFDL